MLERVDLHVHTRFSAWKHLRAIKPRDSYNVPLELYRLCKARGMTHVAITDHDTIDGAIDLLSKHPELEPSVIIGEEVETFFPDTGQWVHVNVFDVDESDHAEMTRLKPNVFELVGWLRRRGVLFVLNHPFQSYRMQKRALDYVDDVLELFTHFESSNFNLSPRHDRAVEEMLDLATGLALHRHGVGGSDAHNMRDVAKAWTEVEVTPEEAAGGKRAWLAAVAAGRGRTGGGTIALGGLTANIYGVIASYFLSLQDPESRKVMRAGNYLAAALLVPACLAGVPALITAGNSARLEAVTLYLRHAMEQAKAQGRLRSTDMEQAGQTDSIV